MHILKLRILAIRKPHRPIFVLFFLLVSMYNYIYTDYSDIDSLKLALRTHEEDTNKAKLLYDLSFSYQGSYTRHSIILRTTGFNALRKTKF